MRVVFNRDSLMLKVHVGDYSRKGPGGQTIQVGSYDDSRQGAKPDAPSAPRSPGAPPAPSGAPRAPRTTAVAPGPQAATTPFHVKQGPGASQGGAFQRPGAPAPKNPWKEHGDKLYLLTGKGEYLHSDNGGAKWNRSTVPDTDLHVDGGARQKVRDHMENQGYINPVLGAHLLPHIHTARVGAKDHPGHFEHGIDESSFRHKQKEAVEADERERADPKPEGTPAADPEAIRRAAAATKPDVTPSDPNEHAKVLGEGEVEAGRPLGTGVSGAHLLKIAGDGRGIFKKGGEHEPNIRYGSQPHGTAHKREIAAGKMDKLLGTGLVPPTVEREHDGVKGSMQAWVEGAQTAHEVPHFRDMINPESPHHNARVADQVNRLALFDAAIGNSDRHAGNLVLTKGGDVKAIDHGLSQTYGLPDSLGQGWGHGAVAVPPDLHRKLKDTTLAEVEDAIGEHVEPWAPVHTYMRMKYMADLADKGGAVDPGDLTTQKLFSYAKEHYPHLHDRMLASWDHGPKPPRWDEISDGMKWPPPGKAGHEHVMRETLEAARTSGRSDKTVPSKPRAAA